jgi:hypothetical protein
VIPYLPLPELRPTPSANPSSGGNQ